MSNCLHAEHLIAEQLMGHLKRLDLRLDSPTPVNLGAYKSKSDKQNIGTLLTSLLRQGYLEKTKLANPAAAAKGGQATQNGQTQRVRATQATARNTQAQGDDAQPTNGSPDEEWRWGSRADKEIGEQAIAAFIKDFYATYPGADRTNQKIASQLSKEIARGATGGNAKGKLLNAHDGEEEED